MIREQFYGSDSHIVLNCNVILVLLDVICFGDKERST